jgi:hypothetical protein
MNTSRRLASTFAAAALAATFSFGAFTPAIAHADGATGKVASHTAKGNIPQSVPVEAGIGLSLCSAILALGLGRRSRR